MVDTVNIGEPKSKFMHSQEKFRCCCGSVHVKHGMIIITAIYTIIVVIDILSMIGYPLAALDIIIQCIFIPLHIGAIIGAIIAVKKERPKLLIIFFVDQVIKFILLLIFLTLFVWGIFDVSSPTSSFIRSTVESKEEEQIGLMLNEQPHMSFLTQITAIFMSIFIGLLMALGLWFCHVAYRCSIYLREIRSARALNDGMVRYDSAGTKRTPTSGSGVAGDRIAFHPGERTFIK